MMNQKIKNFVVVGGGTAGWITALYAKKMYPLDNVILIESEEIGILGAGEGSTPAIINFFNFLEIPTEELFMNCDLTIKNGIKFSNWSSEKNYFFHPFFSNSEASNDFNFELKTMYEENDTAFSHFIATNYGHDLKDYCFIQKVSDKNLIPMTFNENNFLSISDWSIHFDARLLAKYLQSVATNRGVIRKEGTVKNILNDSDGHIVKISTDKDEIEVDFIFDCSGFKRLIIGKHFNSEWKSYQKHLPANTALPFFLPIDEDIPPYTESIAMNFGWMWKIPTQSRYGCGYVFDNNFISLDEAKREVESFIKQEIEVPKTFNFEAGCYKEVWIKNCLAVGLSAGFLEPLEATSIWQSIILLNDFFTTTNNLNKNNKKTIDSFNEKYLSITQEIVDFLYCHYVTDKKNTDFWKHFKNNNVTPDFSQHILDIIKERPLSVEKDFYNKNEIYSTFNYYYILIGNKTLSKDILNKFYNMMKDKKDKNYLSILNNQEVTLNTLISHEDFFKKILKGINR